ncbi:MAG: phage holin family protein [Candidatus Peribacteria bacterium]|jgi:putative membrane protein|nr:phage holin family protein [Candidatus Peribacteria bacterium]
MKLLRNLIANIGICGFLLWLFYHFQLGIDITINPELTDTRLHRIAMFVIMGFVFWLLNSPIKWVIQTLSFPVNMLTLGLFSLLINVVIFYLFAWVMNTYFAPDIVVKLGNLLQTLILSLIMSVGITILKKIV